MTLNTDTQRRNAETLAGWLFTAQQGLCFYCHRWLSAADSSFDHLVPRSLLHRVKCNTEQNLVLAHKDCNVRKGDRYPRSVELRRRDEIYHAKDHLTVQEVAAFCRRFR